VRLIWPQNLFGLKFYLRHNIYNQQSTRMGFFDSIFHNVGNVVSTISHAILGGVSKAVGLVQHAIPKVVDFARKAGDNLVNVGKKLLAKQVMLLPLHIQMPRDWPPNLLKF